MKHKHLFQSLKAVVEACSKDKKLMVIAYVDRAGHLALEYRMPGAWLGSIAVALGKAKTAVFFSGPEEAGALTTEELAKLVKPGQPLYGLEATNRGDLVVFGGGIPVYEDGKLAGAVGVSGGTVEEDIKYAQLAVEALNSAIEEPEGGDDDEDSDEDSDEDEGDDEDSEEEE